LTRSQGPTSLALFPPLRQRSVVLGLNGRAETSGPEAKGLDRVGSCNRAMVGLWRKIPRTAPHTTPHTWEPQIALCLLHTLQRVPEHHRSVHRLRSLGQLLDRFRLCPHRLGHVRFPLMHHHRIAHRSPIPHLYCPARHHSTRTIPLQAPRTTISLPPLVHRIALAIRKSLTDLTLYRVSRRCKNTYLVL